jgi:serine protease Do
MRRTILMGTLLAGAALLAALLVGVRFDVRVRAPDARAEVDGGAFWSEGTSPVASPAPPGGPPSSFADLAEALSPTVVNIQAERASRASPHGSGELFEEFFGRQRRRPRLPPEESTGSGFVVSPDGYIVTNDHVVDGAARLEIHFDDGKMLPGEIVGRDPKTDLALIKVETDQELPVAPLGDSDPVRPGDWVMAIGSPFGLDHTVTVGVLSAKGRRRVTGERYDDFLQTDASINPGNSGGPLFDRNGHVIGINTAIRGGRAQGIGFSIPINMVKELLPQLRASGMVTRGWLGVSIQEVKPALAESFDLESTDGALVGEVFDGSPAESAGIRHGDVIVEFGGEPVETYQDLPRIVARTPPGTDVDVVVLREGERVTLETRLGEMEQEQPELDLSEAPGSTRLADWGFDAETLDERGARELGLDEGTRGALVTAIEGGSAAEAAGLQRGDVVLEANRSDVGDLGALQEILQRVGDKVVLRVQRGRGAHYLVLER